jgi:hypothetical protein
MRDYLLIQTIFFLSHFAGASTISVVQWSPESVHASAEAVDRVCLLRAIHDAVGSPLFQFLQHPIAHWYVCLSAALLSFIEKNVLSCCCLFVRCFQAVFCIDLLFLSFDFNFYLLPLLPA